MSEQFFRVVVCRRQQDADQAVEMITSLWKQYFDADDPLRVEISVEDAQRSDEANRYYFGYVVRPIAEQVWIEGRQYSVQVWHQELRELFATRVDRIHGSVPKETHKMGRREFSKYVQDIEVTFSHAPYFVQFPDRSEPPPWLAQNR